MFPTKKADVLIDYTSWTRSWLAVCSETLDVHEFGVCETICQIEVCLAQQVWNMRIYNIYCLKCGKDCHLCDMRDICSVAACYEIMGCCLGLTHSHGLIVPVLNVKDGGTPKHRKSIGKPPKPMVYNGISTWNGWWLRVHPFMEAPIYAVVGDTICLIDPHSSF